MSATCEQFKTQLATLPVELAQFLIRSLDEDTDADIEAAWEEELKHRLAEIKSGQVVGVPVETVISELRKKYA